MVTAGYLGRKSGAGFYLYENGKKLGVNPPPLLGGLIGQGTRPAEKFAETS